MLLSAKLRSRKNWKLYLNILTARCRRYCFIALLISNVSQHHTSLIFRRRVGRRINNTVVNDGNQNPVISTRRNRRSCRRQNFALMDYNLRRRRTNLHQHKVSLRLSSATATFLTLLSSLDSRQLFRHHHDSRVCPQPTSFPAQWMSFKESHVHLNLTERLN